MASIPLNSRADFPLKYKAVPFFTSVLWK